jgi:hypothetical protein
VSVAVHEASHVAAALMLGRRVESASREIGHALPGEALGRALIPIGGDLEPSQVVIAVIGYMATDVPRWPPPYEKARSEDLEALDLIIRGLGIGADEYDRLVEVARDMLADADFRRLRDALARALAAVPRLEREDIKAIAEAHGFSAPEREETTCST